ncbi:hypothetical protein NXV57_18880 [Bacteroides thetaiotaomicron]|nr:hypothetical protein [Bacteroides thetaiotaomicron]
MSKSSNGKEHRAYPQINAGGRQKTGIYRSCPISE